MKAWHFVSDTLRDGHPVPADGVTLREENIKLCEYGLHASLEPFDALQYAPGNTLCLVECGGNIEYGDDKVVAQERAIIVRMNAEPLLRYFAKQQALKVVHLWNASDVVLDYLMGDETLRDAAWDISWYAARTAARDAALAAAWDEAWVAARTAARDAAWAAANAARDAAWAAAVWTATWAAARTATRKEFNEMVYNAFHDYL